MEVYRDLRLVRAHEREDRDVQQHHREDELDEREPLLCGETRPHG